MWFYEAVIITLVERIQAGKEQLLPLSSDWLLDKYTNIMQEAKYLNGLMGQGRLNYQ